MAPPAGLREGRSPSLPSESLPVAYGGRPNPGASQMSIEETIKGINEARTKASDASREVLDRSLREKRAMTAEEQGIWSRADGEMIRLANKRDEILASSAARAEIANINEEFR